MHEWCVEKDLDRWWPVATSRSRVYASNRIQGLIDGIIQVYVAMLYAVVEVCIIKYLSFAVVLNNAIYTRQLSIEWIVWGLIIIIIYLPSNLGHKRWRSLENLHDSE